ncbi:helix-turn-helix transcriptional regulator [Kitasatospora sp. NPDC049285]|uniref:helix-turn-helix transcriptional regulator n=1 Tax=Kitasatospora sp. NPDC049285 TaxID=3157096 RepID=UPI00343F4284
MDIAGHRRPQLPRGSGRAKGATPTLFAIVQVEADTERPVFADLNAQRAKPRPDRKPETRTPRPLNRPGTPPRRRPHRRPKRRRPLHRAPGPPWADTAERTLHHLEHNPPDNHAGPRLTSAEQRCAQLAAAGASNRDIAAALTVSVSVSVKTVEATLTRVYRKLGLHSSVQLAHALTPARE